MKAVFLGGSRRLSRLNGAIRLKLDELVQRGFWLYVGDAYGADRAIQQHLARQEYGRVIVYSVTGSLRNNVGNWKVRCVDAPKTARGFDLFSVKDVQMAKDASCGLMLWDGKSRGTLENIRKLLAHGKPVTVYLSPTQRFVSLRSPDDFNKIGSNSRLYPNEQRSLPFGEGSSAAQHAGAPGSREVQPRGRRQLNRGAVGGERGRR